MVAFCFGHWLIVNMFQGDRAVYLSEKSARLSGCVPLLTGSMLRLERHIVELLFVS